MKETRFSVCEKPMSSGCSGIAQCFLYTGASPHYHMGVSEKYSSEWTQAQRSFFLFFERIICQIQDNKSGKCSFFPLG